MKMSQKLIHFMKILTFHENTDIVLYRIHMISIDESSSNTNSYCLIDLEVRISFHMKGHFVMNDVCENEKCSLFRLEITRFVKQIAKIHE